MFYYMQLVHNSKTGTWVVMDNGDDGRMSLYRASPMRPTPRATYPARIVFHSKVNKNN